MRVVRNTEKKYPS